MTRETITLEILQQFGVSGMHRDRQGRLLADCPGKRFHTGANNERDFELHLTGAPTGTCFHKSCAPQVADFNRALRSAIGKAEHTGHASHAVTADTSGHLDWDCIIGPQVPIADADFVEAVEIPAPKRAPVDDLKHYLATLFKPEDVVAYNLDATHRDDGKATPAGRGVHTRTAGEIIAALDAQGMAALGTADQDAGAWCRLNPFDGAGVADSNVREFRHALVESDGMDLPKQLAIMRALHLPASLVIHSGGKSLHAVVRVDAGQDLALYKTRVADLYDVLKRNGFEVDNQNRNPSRLSRLPGVMRKGSPQYIVAENIGAATWDAWIAWRNEIDDKLPSFENMGALIANPPPLAPELIQGVLRQGHKLLLSGPSKAGKSFALIQLCVAIGSGGQWLGMACKRGRVLYVNMELDRASCVERFARVTSHLSMSAGGVDVWNLRGHGCSLADLVPKLVRRMQGTTYAAVVVDPIYKLLTGDENSNADMALFCNHLDRIAMLTGASVVVASHFSKGQQGGKASIDRTAGAGVFGRDPDAILTLSELDGAGDDEFPFLVEFTLREFKRPAPVAVEFRYPVHVLAGGGQLDGRKVIGAAGRKPKATGDDLLAALSACEFKGIESPTLADATEAFNATASEPVSDRTIRRRGKALLPSSGWIFDGAVFWRSGEPENAHGDKS